MYNSNRINNIKFGAYVQVHEQHNNSMIPRTSGTNHSGLPAMHKAATTPWDYIVETFSKKQLDHPTNSFISHSNLTSTGKSM